MKYTFGRTAAAQTLEKLVENNPQVRRKISTLLSKYTNQLLGITRAKNKPIVLLCMDLLRKNAINQLHRKKNIPYDVTSYTENVIAYRYRIFSEEFQFVMDSQIKNKI